MDNVEYKCFCGTEDGFHHKSCPGQYEEYVLADCPQCGHGHSVKSDCPPLYIPNFLPEEWYSKED